MGLTALRLPDRLLIGLATRLNCYDVARRTIRCSGLLDAVASVLCSVTKTPDEMKSPVPDPLSTRKVAFSLPHADAWCPLARGLSPSASRTRCSRLSCSAPNCSLSVGSS